MIKSKRCGNGAYCLLLCGICIRATVCGGQNVMGCVVVRCPDSCWRRQATMMDAKYDR
jgi:hypothetical protein